MVLLAAVAAVAAFLEAEHTLAGRHHRQVKETLVVQTVDLLAALILLVVAAVLVLLDKMHRTQRLLATEGLVCHLPLLVLLLLVLVVAVVVFSVLALRELAALAEVVLVILVAQQQQAAPPILVAVVEVLGKMGLVVVAVRVL